LCQAFALHWVQLPEDWFPRSLFVVTRAARYEYW
jgi:hypothetical protein